MFPFFQVRVVLKILLYLLCSKFFSLVLALSLLEALRDRERVRGGHVLLCFTVVEVSLSFGA